MSQQQPPNHADFGNVIFCYTRQQALEDGVLVDASAMAKEAGFTLPVALTAAAWADAVAWNEADNERQAYQDESGRLWDVLFMAAHAIRSDSERRQPLFFSLNRIPRDGRSQSSRQLALKLNLGPGDDGEPVITILLPGED